MLTGSNSSRAKVLMPKPGTHVRNGSQTRLNIQQTNAIDVIQTTINKLSADSVFKLIPEISRLLLPAIRLSDETCTSTIVNAFIKAFWIPNENQFCTIDKLQSTDSKNIVDKIVIGKRSFAIRVHIENMRKLIDMSGDFLHQVELYNHGEEQDNEGQFLQQTLVMREQVKKTFMTTADWVTYTHEIMNALSVEIATNRDGVVTAPYKKVLATLKNAYENVVLKELRYSEYAMRLTNFVDINALTREKEELEFQLKEDIASVQQKATSVKQALERRILTLESELKQIKGEQSTDLATQVSELQESHNNTVISLQAELHHYKTQLSTQTQEFELQHQLQLQQLKSEQAAELATQTKTLQESHHAEVTSLQAELQQCKAQLSAQAHELQFSDEQHKHVLDIKDSLIEQFKKRIKALEVENAKLSVDVETTGMEAQRWATKSTVNADRAERWERGSAAGSEAPSMFSTAFSTATYRPLGFKHKAAQGEAVVDSSNRGLIEDCKYYKAMIGINFTEVLQRVDLLLSPRFEAADYGATCVSFGYTEADAKINKERFAKLKALQQEFNQSLEKRSDVTSSSSTSESNKLPINVFFNLISAFRHEATDTNTFVNCLIDIKFKLFKDLESQVGIEKDLNKLLLEHVNSFIGVLEVAEKNGMIKGIFPNIGNYSQAEIDAYRDRCVGFPGFLKIDVKNWFKLDSEQNFIIRPEKMDMILGLLSNQTQTKMPSTKSDAEALLPKLTVWRRKTTTYYRTVDPIKQAQNKRIFEPAKDFGRVRSTLQAYAVAMKAYESHIRKVFDIPEEETANPTPKEVMAKLRR